ncbi:MAG: glycosyltransferase family 39 protein [Polyangiales bacterium]
MSQPLDRRAVALRLLVAVGGTLVALGILSEGTPPAEAGTRTLAELIAPLAPGREVADGFVLALPHRGETHDIVLPARRSRGGRTTTVELHLLDRGTWRGVRTSAHYDIAWEQPRSTATQNECEAVTERLASVVRANDVRDEVPVDALTLAPDVPRPHIARALSGARGGRAFAIAALLALTTWALATLPLGGFWAGAFLFALGLALRVPHLDVPFVRDQDVQRLFTGHASLVDIFTGIGLRDRHPPLYFAVLHAAQLFGQSEAVVRAPAVLAGALAGPMLVLAAAVTDRKVVLAALLGLVPATSASFVAHSREVSSLPFYALVLTVLAMATVRYQQTGSRGWYSAVVASVVVALFTYYTAVFAVAALLCCLLWLGPTYGDARRALGVGLACGSPALALAAYTFVRDRGARLAAESRPSLAWGDRSVIGTAEAMADVVREALGPALVVAAFVAVTYALRRREGHAPIALALVLGSFVGIAGLAPVARVQPYYLLAALPVLLLAASWSPLPTHATRRLAVVATCGLLVSTTVADRAMANATLYTPDERAIAPDFAILIASRPERRVVTVAHYDMTLFAYYLGRASGVEVDYASLEARGDAFALRGTPYVFHPLVQTHDDGASAAGAAAALDTLVQAGPCLVVDRPTLPLDGVRERLQRCTPLGQGPDATLYHCAPDDVVDDEPAIDPATSVPETSSTGASL